MEIFLCRWHAAILLLQRFCNPQIIDLLDYLKKMTNWLGKLWKCLRVPDYCPRKILLIGQQISTWQFKPNLMELGVVFKQLISHKSHAKQLVLTLLSIWKNISQLRRLHKNSILKCLFIFVLPTVYPIEINFSHGWTKNPLIIFS